MIEIVNKFEKLIYAVLMALLMFVLLAAIGDLVWLLFQSLIVTTPVLLEAHELVTVLGAFLLVLIGIELLDTIKAYFIENTIHVEIVILLALIAIARKVILLDPTGMNGFEFGFELMGIGVIVIGLGACYYLIKKAGITIGPGVQKPE
ncbi:MAG: phosphate-starvation-inducible PsiE family protein [Methanoregula sp.]|nr:phosphate-starvation-inducible PsiE family protein [Methanoregula sp.]